jgi:hypothetical protein
MHGPIWNNKGFLYWNNEPKSIGILQSADNKMGSDNSIAVTVGG